MKSTIDTQVSILRVIQLYLPRQYRNHERNYSTNCPFHDDRNPSFRVNVTDNLCRCYGSCSRAWGPTELVSEVMDCSHSEAVDDMAKKLNLDIEALKRMEFIALMAPVEHKLPQLQPITKEMIEYLISRSIDPAVIEGEPIGAEGHRIAFICKTRSIINTVISRRTDEQEPRYVVFPGPLAETPWRLERTDFSNPILLVEGPTSTLSMMSVGISNVASIRPAGWNPTSVSLLSSYPRVIFLLDPDEKGRKIATTVQRQLSTIVEIVTPQADANDLLRLGDLQDFANKVLKPMMITERYDRQ